MAVFRVERNTGYTVMSNHHLRNKELSLKAKGLLSQMLSLPEDWDYTLSGLSYINRESIDAIRTAVWELEKAGYITRRQGRDEKGKMTAIEYTIYEQPQPPELDCPVLENPTADNPILENPTTDNPTSENPMQLNKDISRTNLPKKEKSNTDLSITHSIPIHSLNPLPYGEDEAAQPPERKRAERNDAYRVYEEIIKDNEHGERVQPAGQYLDGNPDPQLGKFERFEAQPNDPEALHFLMREEKRSYDRLKPGDFKAHITVLHDSRIEAEAQRILAEMKRQDSPNSPNKTHFMVELSPYFMQLASTKDTDRLFAMLPYKTLSFSKIEGRHGTFAFLDKSEDRSRNIRKARPSVRAQLTADKKTAAPKKAAAKRKNHDLEV